MYDRISHSLKKKHLVHEMWYIHTVGYYSAIRRNEIPIYAITWVGPENIMLGEISQIQKDRYCTILPI